MNQLTSLILFLTLLPGCEMLGLTDGADKKKADAAAAAKAKKEANLEDGDSDEDDYTYNPIGKRDPFKSFLSRGDDGDDDDLVARTPLQKYDVTQFLLTAIVWDIPRPIAHVKDPKGNGHIMEMGTYIGKNWGKVTNINDNSVIITEEYTTNQGELVIETIEMTLRNEPTESFEY